MLGCPANLTEGPLRDVRFILMDILCLPYSSCLERHEVLALEVLSP